MGNSVVMNAKHDEKPSELNVSLRLNPTDELRKAKRRMEHCFMEDYSVKMKAFKRVDRPEYEGEYMFFGRVAVNDENTVELKDIVTMCKLTKLEVESDKSDEDYSPESD